MSSESQHPKKPTNGGIFDGFEGYRTATRADYVTVLGQGLVVLDANVLLDLYRFGKQGRDDLIAALRAIGDRLWVPNHAMVEFWRNREGILKDPGGTVQLVKTLTTSKDTIVKALDTWGKQRSHAPETVTKLTAVLTQSFESIESEVAELSKEETALWARDTSQDEVLKALNGILDGQVGGPLSEEAYGAALVEAKRRGDEQIPPGYLDAKKPEPDSAGDYLVWEQLLLETAHRQLDVLLITRDAKDDWVRREGGEIRGPRMELINEALARTGHRFFLRTPAQLLDLAKDALNVAVHTESVENADRISREMTEWELNSYSARALSELKSNLRSADVLLTELEQIDHTAGTALKLAAIRDGRLDGEVLARLNIFPSVENLEAVVDNINAVIGRFVQRGLASDRALLLLIPVFNDSDGELAGYRIHPDFIEPLRRASVPEYAADQWPENRSRVERDMVIEHPGQRSLFETTLAGTRVPLSNDTIDGQDGLHGPLKKRKKKTEEPGDRGMG